MIGSKTLGVRIAGTGSCLPAKVVTNDDLAQTLDTSDEWIRTRTGISERRFASDGEATSDFAIPAARNAMEAAGVAPEDVDMIVCATMTPDYVMPNTAALMQRELGLVNAGGYDINSACTGFVLALATGGAFVKSGLSKCCLVVAAEMMSAITKPDERSTRVIFGDGSGAVVLQAADDGAASDILGTRRGLKGNEDVLVMPASGTRNPITAEVLERGDHLVHMKGRETFKFAVKTFVSLIKGTCEDAGISPQDLKLVVPHQVNLRILESACERAGLSLDDCWINIDKVGNTSAASAAIALDEAVRAGRLERGDLVLVVAFGGGLSWGSVLLRW